MYDQGVVSLDDYLLDLEIDEMMYETDKAWKVSIDGEEYWFPKKVCNLHKDTISIPEWLAKKNGLV